VNVSESASHGCWIIFVVITLQWKVFLLSLVQYACFLLAARQYPACACDCLLNVSRISLPILEVKATIMVTPMFGKEGIKELYDSLRSLKLFSLRSVPTCYALIVT
jgi:hypothetical protein